MRGAWRQRDEPESCSLLRSDDRISRKQWKSAALGAIGYLSNYLPTWLSPALHVLDSDRWLRVVFLFSGVRTASTSAWKDGIGQ
jgi:hypothetical protein